jgi:predicted molibdopterin-dependent oxidoreductase YjgC
MTIELHIDGRPVSVPEGATVLDAARTLDIAVPTMCHLKGAKPFTSCMVCLVEDKTTAKLLPACSSLAQDGMTVETDTAQVREARKRALELLLSEHVGDCEGPCRCACPVHLDIPRLLRAAGRGDWRAARSIVDDAQPPCVREEDCAAPCERVCRRRQVDAAVSIRAVVRCAGGVSVDAAGRTTVPAFERNVSVIGKLKDEEKAPMMRDVSATPPIVPADSEGGYSASEAMQEAQRCMHCDCRKAHDCALRDYAIAYEADQRHYSGGGRRPFEQFTQHADILYEPGKCIRCGICVRITEREKEPLGLTFIGRGFDVRIGVPFEESLADGLRDVARACAEACPTGALCVREEEHDA